MDAKVRNDIERRRGEKNRFYEGFLGTQIKKRRIDLKMTQESVGKGIISNTFVSKLENNAIRANKECMMLLMERLELSPALVDQPEDLIRYLNRSLDCFYWLDGEGFQKLHDEIEKYDFAVLVQIVRLGYAVLFRQKERAVKIQTELYRYLPSMDNWAFSIFMMYSAANLIALHEYGEAQGYLNSLAGIMPSDSKLMAMKLYHESVVFGKIQVAHRWQPVAEMARQMFSNVGNFRRLMQMNVDKLEFMISEKTHEKIDYRPEYLGLMDQEDADRFHLVLGLLEENPLDYCAKIGPTSRYFPISLFVQCQFHWAKGNVEIYEKTKDRLREHQEAHRDLIDLHQLLVLQKTGDLTEYKDFLIQEILPYARRTNDVLLLRTSTDIVVDILAKKKRYKDACSYQEKLKNDLQKIQNAEKNN